MKFRLRFESESKDLARGKRMCKGLKVEKSSRVSKTKTQCVELVFRREVHSWGLRKPLLHSKPLGHSQHIDEVCVIPTLSSGSRTL